eukprot:PhM_4_TR7640/c0_g1_i1/m.77351
MASRTQNFVLLAALFITLTVTTSTLRWSHTSMNYDLKPPSRAPVGVVRQHTEGVKLSTPPPISTEIEPSPNNNNDCRLPALSSLAQPSHIKSETRRYLEDSVVFAVVTGSFEQFFRVDLGLCTWLAHVPESKLFIYTDNANASDGRRGNWVEGKIPRGVQFTKQQLQAKGYTIHWIRAQYRFIQGLDDLTRKFPQSKWFVVVDDDTFINLDSMVTLMRRLDAKRGGGPLYVGDHGWGGAGHFFNKPSGAVLRRSLDECVDRLMVKSFAASDVMIKKCVPTLGIATEWEKLVSHCQANFLRERMIKGDHVSYHVKREMVEPRRLAQWRLRLYYDVVFKKNYTTAYDLLLKVGACAYGSCKNNKCDKQHDADAIAYFNELSLNDTVVPDL